MKKIADHIQNFISEYNNSEYIHWYLISLDIIESELFKEKPAPRKKSILKYKCNINFTNKALDFINVARILCSKEIIDSHPDFVEQVDIPMIMCTLTHSNIFRNHAFVKDLNIQSFVENPNTVPCVCSKFDPRYIDKSHQHILTGDLKTVSNARLKNFFLKVLNIDNLLI